MFHDSTDVICHPLADESVRQQALCLLPEYFLHTVQSDKPEWPTRERIRTNELPDPGSSSGVQTESPDTWMILFGFAM